MADGNQLKMDDKIDVADDDPFAELTRIMGFDPRQSVKEAEARAGVEKSAGQDYRSVDANRTTGVSKASAPVENAASDDFNIDLEKELMGDFSIDDEDFAASLDAPYDDEPAMAADAVEDKLSASTERPSEEADFDFDFEDAIAASVASEAALDEEEADDSQAEIVSAVAAETFAAQSGADHDLDIDAQLDAAMANVDFDPDSEDHRFESPAPSDSEQDLDKSKAEEKHQDAEMERHLAEAVDSHLGTEDLQLDAADLGASSDEAALDDFLPEVDEVSFDAADLDFEVDDLTAEGSEQSEARDYPEPEGDEVSETAQEPRAYPESDIGEADQVEIGLHASDFDLDDSDERADARGYEPQAPEAVYEDELVDDEEFAISDDVFQSDLEESAGSAASVEDARTYETAHDDEYYGDEEAPRAEAARPVSPMDQAAAEYRGRESAPLNLASAFNLEEELNALLGNKTARNVEPEMPATSRNEPLSSAERDDDLAWELEDLVAAAASAESALEEDEPEPEEAEDEGTSFQPAFTRGFGPDRGSTAAFADRNRDSAPIETQQVQRSALPSSRESMFASAPAFSERYKPQSPAATADYMGERPAARPSAGFAMPRDPMREDPLDVIAELAAKYSQPLPTNAFGQQAKKSEYAPDVETIEVADRAVALEDDLDLPEVDFDDELPPVSAYDDLDTDFASLLHDMNDADAVPAEVAHGYGSNAGTNASRQQMAGGAAPVVGSMSTIPGAYAADADAYDLDADDLPGSRRPAADQYGNDDFDYDPDLDDALAVPGMAAAHREAQPKRRGLLVAAIVGGVALVGALGAFALSSGDGDSDAVAIVKADDGPIKVKPENPGGTTVPNQDSKVYDTVSGDGTVADPQQEKLVTTAEEPVDMMPANDDVESGAETTAKSEDRIEQILQEAENKSDAEITAVAPRKVRTLVVRPDGTLVPREDTETASDNIQTDAVAADTAGDATSALPDPVDQTAVVVPDAEPTTGAVDEAQPEVEVAATPPATAPVAPERPVEQPVDVVGEVKPEQVASAATSAVGGGWSMQIASQPSEEAAQISYKNLVARYGSVLNGREANIVKADIAGKGTFWRVRIPAASRSDAISLCETYKAAGGNCFVSK